MKDDRHCCVHERGAPRCKQPYFISLRVRMFHPASLRKTWARWDFCQEHYARFVTSGGRGWFRWYGGAKRENAIVIGYEKGGPLEGNNRRWKPLGRANFIIDPTYPSAFVDTDLEIHVNLAKIPATMPFDDLVFYVNHAILTETLCYYCLESGYQK